MENFETNQNLGEVEEVKLDEIKVPDDTDSLIKDFFIKENGATIKELASLFGQSEYELKKEFGSYKAKKISNKLTYFIEAGALKEHVYKQVQTADKLGFYGVTLYPTMVSLAKSVLKSSSVKIRALISYPFGEECYKTVKASVKSAFENGASEIIITLSTYLIKNGNLDEICKIVKKAIKIARKKEVYVLIDLDLLTPSEIELVIKKLLELNLSGFTYKACCGVDKQVIENAVNLVENKAKIEWFSLVETSEDVVSAFLSGAGLLTTPKCVEVVEDLNKKINCVGALDSQALDKTIKEEYN